MKKISLHERIIIWQSQKDDGSTNKSLLPRKILERLKIDNQQIFKVNQVHGSEIINIDRMALDEIGTYKIPSADGMVSNISGVVLLLKTADCIPIVIYDAKNKAVGLFHAGWRGVMKTIYLKGLNKMITEFGTKVSEVWVWLGPGIGKCCYKMIDSPVQATLPEWEGSVEKIKNEWHVDLKGFIFNSLMEVGIRKENIVDEETCTYHNSDEWFSFTRHKNTGETDGRMATLVWLE